MNKTLIAVAAVALSAGLVGVAAASSGSSTGEQSPAVVSVTPAATSTSDDPATHDVGDDHGSGGHGADDAVPSPTTVAVPSPSSSVVVPSHSSPSHSSPSHDVGDDHGSGGHGADD